MSTHDLKIKVPATPASGACVDLIIGLAGGDAVYAVPDGIDSAAFGDVAVTGSAAQVHPSGFDSAAFGSPSLDTHYSPVLATTIGDYSLAIRPPTTALSPACPVSLAIKTKVQRVTPYSIGFETTLGYPHLGFQVDEVTLTGIPPGAVGQPVIDNGQRSIYPASIGGSSAIGQPFVSLLNRPVYPATWDSSVVSAATFFLQHKWIYPSGITAGSVGQPKFGLYNQPVYPQGIAPGGFGTTFVWNQHRFVYPVGWESSAMGGVTVRGTEQYIGLQGIPPTGVSNPTVYNYDTVVSLEGTLVGFFGALAIRNFLQYVLVGSVPAGGIGNPTVRGSSYVLPNGVDFHGVGEPFVSSFLRYIHLSGFTTTEVSPAVVENRNQTISLEGVFPGEFGQPQFPVDPTQSFGCAAVAGGSFGSISVVNAVPSCVIGGIDSAIVPDSLSVDLATHYIAPSAISDVSIPEPVVSFWERSIYPEGFCDNSFCEPRYTQYVVLDKKGISSHAVPRPSVAINGFVQLPTAVDGGVGTPTFAGARVIYPEPAQSGCFSSVDEYEHWLTLAFWEEGRGGVADSHLNNANSCLRTGVPTLNIRRIYPGEVGQSSNETAPYWYGVSPNVVFRGPPRVISLSSVEGNNPGYYQIGIVYEYISVPVLVGVDTYQIKSVKIGYHPANVSRVTVVQGPGEASTRRIYLQSVPFTELVSILPYNVGGQSTGHSDDDPLAEIDLTQVIVPDGIDVAEHRFDERIYKQVFVVDGSSEVRIVPELFVTFDPNLFSASALAQMTWEVSRYPVFIPHSVGLFGIAPPIIVGPRVYDPAQPDPPRAVSGFVGWEQPVERAYIDKYGPKIPANPPRYSPIYEWYDRLGNIYFYGLGDNPIDFQMGTPSFAPQVWAFSSVLPKIKFGKPNFTGRPHYCTPASIPPGWTRITRYGRNALHVQHASEYLRRVVYMDESPDPPDVSPIRISDHPLRILPTTTTGYAVGILTMENETREVPVFAVATKGYVSDKLSVGNVL